MYKSSGERYEKPKSSEYEVVKPILKEIFFDHYNLAVRLLSKTEINEGEFYILKNSKNCIEVHGFFPVNQNVLIRVYDSIDDFDLTVSIRYGHKERPNCRKKGTLIPKEQLIWILRLTVKFLYDPDSFKILLDSFLKNLLSLTTEGEEIEDLMLSTDQTIKTIIEKLEFRKKTIEKRLIEVDNDPELDRIKLRGEIEGLNYALTTTKIYT